MTPITYDGSKEPALRMHLATLGHRIEQNDAAWLSTADQSVIDAFGVADARVYLRQVVDQKAATVREQHFGAVDTYERDTWATKLEQAQEYDLTKLDSVAPMLKAEADKRGVTVQSVADRVLANSAAYQAVIGAISGRAGKLKDDIDAASSWSHLRTVVGAMKIGWP